MNDYATQYQHELERARRLAHTLGRAFVVRVQTCNDEHVCASCAALAKHTYSLDAPPTLPHPHCAATGGCRCWATIEPK